jgi:PKD repeat protein
VLTASLTSSPTTGTPATIFSFDAGGSTAGTAPIDQYVFSFGDATPDVVGPTANTTHRFATTGTYTVRVTVRDTAGGTATKTVTVSVTAVPAP